MSLQLSGALARSTLLGPVGRTVSKPGSQRVSELNDFKKLDFLGTIPEQVQQTVAFIARATGLDPVTKP